MLRDAQRPRVVIAGAGIAGLEAAMALADAAGALVEIVVVAPDREFVLKPMAVVEPFGGGPPERRGLAPIFREIGATHVRSAVSAVEPASRTVVLADGTQLTYDFLAICVGARARPAFDRATTFWSDSSRLSADDLVEAAAASPSRTLAIVIPPGTSWPLPAYELALMLRRHADEHGRRDLIVRMFTPEDSPLRIFGTGASAAVAARLAAGRIVVSTGSRVEELEGELRCVPGNEGPIEAGSVIALPQLEGPAMPGLPMDQNGFIQVDERCRVLGCENVFAAGDGTSFPVKQGGLGAQQARVAATHIAAAVGAPADPQPFRPVLRGELLTGSDSLKMSHSLAGGDPGAVSSDYLWWPRQKVAGRFLSAWLGHTVPAPDLGPREMPIEVEASWPHEWHGVPMGSPEQSS